MPGVNGHTHHQLQLNDSWNGWKNKDRMDSLLPRSSGNSVALSQGREQRVLKCVENFCKTLQGPLKTEKDIFL